MNILFVIALTFPVAVASTAFSLNSEQFTMNNLQLGTKLFYSLIFALGQGLMYWLGSLLGGTFMHLLERLSHWIIVALCFSVSYRMLIDTLKIKNGTNLLFVENKKHLLLLSVALGINPFIIGLFAEFYQPFPNITPYILMIVAFVWSVVSMIVPFSKLKLTFYSLLNIIFAAMVLVRGLLMLV
ncbi:MAG: manganese efflux pump [Bacteroidales bacterium]|nr:manganese efflux pump [Bacteroidales bacterium]